ncbi:MAG: hypothetical protein DCC65_09135 [Planctomycetota bacterium]|nr:MAG: hypothetical protein DCC65_09135 [Planctomycetota bacterium]
MPTLLAISLLSAILNGAASAQGGGLPTAEEVDAAIQRGVDALLGEIGDEDVIEYRAAEGGSVQRVRGKVTRQSRNRVFIATENARVIEIQRKHILQWDRAGYVRQEMDGYHHGGPTALAAVALLSAGVAPSHPKMVRVLDTMGASTADQAGTYVRSLRAVAWSIALDRALTPARRRELKKYLAQEVRWLVTASREKGGYGYTATDGPRWDNSNTQFANLGVWAGTFGGAAVPASYWRRVSEHWLSTQNSDGGWSYTKNETQSTASMTVAGCNSLYLVLDRLHSKSDGPYRWGEGSVPDARAREQMTRLYDAIRRGDELLARVPPDISQFDGYELFGLERLGLASGRSVVGANDWFLRYVGGVSQRVWGKGTIGDAFALIFLAHGHAPVLIQKLEYGTDPNQWNYYHRDLAGLCRYLTRTFEKLYRWQIISERASLGEFLAAPLLYIGGSGELVLPEQTQKRVRDYIDSGGTVLLHADRASARFAKSAARIFEGLMAERGWRFADLPERHPLFSCYFGGPGSNWERPVPVSAMSDGSRPCVLLITTDVAGAWHQEKKRFADCFKLLANVRVFSVPPYSELPRPLPAERSFEPPSLARGTLRVARLAHRGKWNVHANVWNRASAGIRRRTGIDVVVAAPIRTADELADARPDVLHVAVPDSTAPDDGTRAILRAAAAQGTLIFIEAADGQPDGIGSVRAWVDGVDSGERSLLMADHSIVSGRMPGGRALGDLQTTESGAGLVEGGLAPPAYLRVAEGRTVLVGCPFDVSAGLEGHFIWNRAGYLPESTAAFVDNLLLMCLEQETSRR